MLRKALITVLMIPLSFSCLRAGETNRGFDAQINSCYSQLIGKSRNSDVPAVPADNNAISSRTDWSSDPVIITVSGLRFDRIGWGPFEYENLKKILGPLLPWNLSDDPAEFEKEFLRKYNEYFLLNEDDAKLPPSDVDSQAIPENYVEMKVRRLALYNDKIVVMPFIWSRDPDDTKEVLPVLMEKIREVWKTYGGKRPIFILAHSWGSVLVYNALHRLSGTDPEIRIDKLLTIGSPLVPGNLLIKMLLGFEEKKEEIEKSVTHPKNLGYWENLWAKRDIYSNNINAADHNLQIDKDVENLEPRLIDLFLHDKNLKKKAARDLKVLRHVKKWHRSYLFDFKAYLGSVDKKIHVEVYGPVITPKLLYYEY